MAFPLLGPIISGLGAILSPIAELGKKWIEKKQVEAQGKIDIEKAKVEGEVKRLQTSQEQEGQYNTAAQEGMKYSWKDEWLTLLWSAPFIMCFIPASQPYVKEGFEVLKTFTPEWYQWGFLGILVASFGLKGWNVWKKE